MLYIYRVRRLVKLVVDEMHVSTDPIDSRSGNPSLAHCLIEFRKLSKKYTPEMARKVLAIATGDKKYISIDNSNGEQRLIVTSEGVILLTPTGYLNALGEAIAKISPIVSLLISIAALVVSILVAIHQHH
jgi:hypothetical protein